jgi:Family of unknown function (DUF5681)
MSQSVGPGRPPRHSHFKKGQSGNQKGRPKSKKEPAGSAFDIVLDKTLTVMKDGVPRELTVAETLQHQMYQKAIEGSRRAQQKIFEMIRKREEYLANQKSRTTPAVDVRFEPEDPDNANQAMLILGIASRDEWWERHGSEYEHLLLEPWAVQAALSRRRGGERLNDKQIADIKRCTRDADTLRWPRSVDK